VNLQNELFLPATQVHNLRKHHDMSLNWFEMRRVAVIVRVVKEFVSHTESQPWVLDQNQKYKQLSKA
jgi:hypothetical protein